jgi:hypothetical protein
VSRRSRALVGALFVVLHLAFFVPLVDRESSIVEFEFRAAGEAVIDGAEPYSELDFEYPPLALPVMIAPAAVTEGVGSYTEAFAWEMLAIDLGVVLLLSLALPGPPKRVWMALGIYSVGLALISVRVEPEFEFRSSLILHRFDLLPAALVLAGALARAAARSATWSALVATGMAVKAFPGALYPAFWRGERNPRRVVVAGLVAIAVSVALVLALGDWFWSAITYHSDRRLQIETVGASILLLIDLFGGEAEIVGGSGSVNLAGTGAEVLRLASIVAVVACYVLVIRRIWVRRTGALEAAVVVVAPLVVLAPILSPQFLVWLLPVSAAAYGFRAANWVLVAACLLTGILASYYSQSELSPRFEIWLAVRNGALLVYLTMVLAPLFRPAPATMSKPAVAG